MEDKDLIKEDEIWQDYGNSFFSSDEHSLYRDPEDGEIENLFKLDMYETRNVQIKEKKICQEYL